MTAMSALMIDSQNRRSALAVLTAREASRLNDAVASASPHSRYSSPGMGHL
jgi:hypothetical protein